MDFRAEVKDVDKETKTLGYGQNEDDMGRLNTQDKLLMYGVVQEVKCALCGLATKNLDHLFFSCTFFSSSS